MTQRIILFRGKRIDNGEWVEGSLGYNSRYRTHYITVHNRPTIPSDMSVEVDPATVGQFTGEIDKNENRIFEGDIATDKDLIKYTFDFKGVARGISNLGFPLTIDNPIRIRRSLEVIGTIHTK